MATNGFIWRTAMKSAGIFSSILQNGRWMPVISNWLNYKDLPDFKYDLHKEIKQIQGVRYE